MHLVSNRQLAVDMGIDRDNTLLLQDGDSALLTPRGSMRRSVPSGWVYGDGKGVGDVTVDVTR